jgi:hypothetical protein
VSDELIGPSHDARRLRARLAYGAAVMAVIVTGLAIRAPGLGLPWMVAKYAGSVLWGTMIYLLLAMAAPDATARRRAGIAALIAALLELSRLYHASWLDEFRLTPAGALLLGRIFSGWNILAYWTGIAGGMVADTVICGRRSGRATARVLS